MKDTNLGNCTMHMSNCSLHFFVQPKNFGLKLAVLRFYWKINWHNFTFAWWKVVFFQSYVDCKSKTVHLKIRLFGCDIRYCIIKFDLMIFKFEHSVLNYFIHAEVDILNLFLNLKKSFRYCFYKKDNPGVTLQQFTELWFARFIQTCIKRRI